MIIRTEKTQNYTAVLNAPFRDSRLSWDTRGLLAYLLTRPPDWVIQFQDLLSQGDAGRESLQRMLKELETYGYLYRCQIKGADGRFKTESIVYESPDINPHFTPGQPVGGKLYGRGQQSNTAPDLNGSGAVVLQATGNGLAVTGLAVTGLAVTGLAGNGSAADGSTGNGQAVSILNTDLLLSNEGLSNEGVVMNDKESPRPAEALPPHMKAYSAMYDSGLDPERQALMNQVRTVIGVRDPVDALDITNQLHSLGVRELSKDGKTGQLVEALKKVGRGVKPQTLATNLMDLIQAEATAAEVMEYFSPVAGSFWTATSGMTGRAWPSQIAAQIDQARQWKESPPPAAAPSANGNRPNTSAGVLASAAAAAARRSS